MIRTIEINEGESPIFVARIERANGDPITLASITSFEMRVFCLTSSTPATPVKEIVGLPGDAGFSDVMSQEYANLMGDSEGHNFFYVLDYDEFNMLGANVYRVQMTVYTTSFDKTERWNVEVGEVL